MNIILKCIFQVDSLGKHFWTDWNKVKSFQFSIKKKKKKPKKTHKSLGPASIACLKGRSQLSDVLFLNYYKL